MRYCVYFTSSGGTAAHYRHVTIMRDGQYITEGDFKFMTMDQIIQNFTSSLPRFHGILFTKVWNNSYFFMKSFLQGKKCLKNGIYCI